MTLALTNFTEAAAYNHALRGVAYNPVAAWYLQAHTGDPGEDGTANVLATAGTVRQAVSFSAAASRQVASAVDVEFGPFLADPPPVTHLSVWDALAAGNCLAQGANTGSVDTDDNGVIDIPAGQLTIAFSSFATSPLADISSHLANGLLNRIFRNQAFAVPTGHVIALYSSNPGIADSGNQLSGNGYSPQAVTWGAPTDGIGSNSGAVVFGPVTGANWAAVTHVASKDGSGNLLTFGALASSFTLLVGQSWRWDAGELVQKFG